MGGAGAYGFGGKEEVYKGKYILNLILDLILGIIVKNCIYGLAGLICDVNLCLLIYLSLTSELS